jgi:acetyl-CoA decarbonylase/synthase complex subunit gamma
MAMNFTGSTTFTSLSGVQKEMKTALPAQIAMAGVGLAGWILSKFI